MVKFKQTFPFEKTTLLINKIKIISKRINSVLNDFSQLKYYEKQVKQNNFTILE